MSNYDSPASPLRFAVIGIGSMGSAHATALYQGKIEHAVLCAVCDTDPQRLEWAKTHLCGVAQYDDYRALLAQHVADAVIIATPHYFHPIIAIDAFAAGMHVLSEKPAGVRVSDVYRMNEAAKASGHAFGIMFNQRTNPLFAQARKLVQSGELGNIKRMEWTVTNWYRTQAYYDSGDWRATWGGEGGGVLLNQAPHNLDLWQWICGMPKSLYAHCAAGRYHHIEVEDDCTIVAVYENGATATFITSTGENPGTNRLEIIGEKGKIIVTDGKLDFYKLSQSERDVCFSAPRSMSEYIPFEKITYAQQSSQSEHLQILQNFTNHILYGETLIAPGYDGIFSLSLSNAAYLSAWQSRTVSLPLSKEDLAAFDAALDDRILHSSYRKAEHVLSKKTSNDTDAEGNSGNYQKRWLNHWS